MIGVCKVIFGENFIFMWFYIVKVEMSIVVVNLIGEIWLCWFICMVIKVIKD